MHSPTPIASMPKARSLARACSSAGLSHIRSAIAHSGCIQGNPELSQVFHRVNRTAQQNFRFPQLVALQQKVCNPKDYWPQDQHRFPALPHSGAFYD